MSRKHLFLVFLGSLAISFLLYGNGIKGNFVYDDQFFAGRSELRSAGHLANLWLEPYEPSRSYNGVYRPLAIFSFSLNFVLLGSSPVSFHTINIILNAVSVFLLFILVLKLFDNINLALFSALFYGFLPIHTEAVAFIKSRDELLATIFILLAWLLFIKSTEKSINWKGIFGSSVLFLLSLLSKEIIILSPLLFLAILRIKKKTSLEGSTGLAFGFAPATLLYFWMRSQALGKYVLQSNAAGDYISNPLVRANFWEHLWTPFKIAFIYIGKIFIPLKLSATYRFNQLTLVNNPLYSIEAIGGIAFIGVLIYLVVNKKTRGTSLGIGALSFLISYMLISKFFYQSADIVGERWMYFPSAGLSIMAGYIINKVYEYKKELGVILLALILLTYGSVTIIRNRVWLTDEALANSMIKDAPDSVQGYLQLIALNHKKPINELEGLIKITYGIAPDYPKVLIWKGGLEAYNNNFESAEKYFSDAIRGAPGNGYEDNLPSLYRFSADFYAKHGDFDSAVKQLKKFEQLSPNSYEPYYLLGQIYTLKKDYLQASAFFRKALALDPNNVYIKRWLASTESRNRSDWNELK